MIVQPIDYALLVWFVLAGLSTPYVGRDQFRNNPEPAVMKWGFILVTLYMGPLGLLHLRSGGPGASTWDARAVHGSALETRSRQHYPLCGG